MLRDARRNLEILELLLRNQLRVGAHDEVNLVRAAIDLLEQSLQINRSARTSRGDNKFHPGKIILSLNLIGYGGNKIRHDQKTLTHPLSGARSREDSLVLQGRARTEGASSPYLGPRLAPGFFESA